MYPQISPFGNIQPGINGVALSSTSTQFNWAPSLFAVRIIGIACTVSQDCTVTAPVCGFYYRPTAGNNTGRVLLGQLIRPLADWVRGNVVVKDIIPRIIKPGEDVLFSVDTAATAGNGHPHFLFDPMWDISGISGRIFQF